MGTAHYLAPELARGEIASPLSDVYALGVVAYECLAGWRPFDGDNQVAVATAHLQDEPPPLPETIPAQVRAIVVAAMAKNPAERPQGANALATLMEDLRLRGLAGGMNNLPPEPIQAWPSDAATPPRGVPARPPQQHATRRSAALDRQSGSGRGAQSSRPRRSTSGYNDAARPTPGFPDLSRPPASYNDPGYGDSAFPDLGLPPTGYSGTDSDVTAYPSRPRGNHGRRGPSSPSTSQMPAGRSGGRPPRRKVSIPLAALIVLVVVVLLGSLWAKARGNDDDPGSMRAPHSQVTAGALAPVTLDGG
jgi:serine/threonine-protein kinase